MSDTQHSAQARRDRGLVAIALFKVVKTILLITVALGAFRFMSPEVMASAERWAATLSSNVGRRAVESVLGRVGGVGHNRMLLTGIGALAYALLFGVEGTGLWMQKRWAEWLSVIATASLVPFEIYEIVRCSTPTRIVALVANLAVVVYLVVRLCRRRDD